MLSVQPPGSGGTNWLTGAEFDFATLASVGIVNGANVLGGYSWFAENAANASVFQVVNGSGLRMEASSAVTSNYWSGLRTAPILSIPLITLAPSVDWTTVVDLRVMCTLTYGGAATPDNEEGFNFSLEAYSQEAGFVQTFSAISHITLGGANVLRIFNGASAFANINDGGRSATDNQLVMRARPVPYFYNTYSAPANADGSFVTSNWRFRGAADAGANNLANAIQSTNNIKDPSSLAIALSIRNGGIAGHANRLLATVRRIKVEYIT